MKKGLIFKVISTILWIIVFILTAVTVTDYMLVKNEKEPIFCLSRDVKEVSFGKTYICNGILYKYYHTVGDNYVSKKFIPIWNKSEDSNE